MLSSQSLSPRSQTPAPAFTLVELLVVMSIIAVLLGVLTPVFTSLTSSRSLEAGSYDIASALESARSYAMANNTYTWVGFFEESANQPRVAGTGNVVVSAVAAKDGVQGFDPTAAASASNRLDGTRLIQIGKLLKVGNTHLAAFDDGTGDGTTFDRRPKVGIRPYRDEYARIGDSDPPTGDGKPSFPFNYPVGSGTPQYTFTKIIQFDPQGESRVNSTSSTKPIVEIGVRPTHGNAIDTRSQNTVAVQLSGIAGTVKIYRK